MKAKKKREFIDSEPLTQEQEAELQYELDTLSDFNNEVFTPASVKALKKISIIDGAHPQIAHLLAKIPQEAQMPIWENIGDKDSRKPFAKKMKIINIAAKKNIKHDALKECPEKLTALYDAFALTASIAKETSKLNAMLSLSKRNKDLGQQKKIGQSVEERMLFLKKAAQQVDLVRETLQKQITGSTYHYPGFID